jgi:type IV pilus assembly protein PilW
MTTRPRGASAGFSLIELMVAMTIGLVVLTVLATVFASTSSGRGDLERVSRLVENSRFAADIVGDDVRHAGFYGTFMPPSDAVFGDPAPCGWNTADVTQLGWQPTASPPRFPAHLQGFDDPGAALAPLNCLPDRVAGTDVLVIRRAGSRPVLPAQVSPTSVYVQASQCINDAAPLRVSNTAAQFTLRTAACDVANLAAIRRYFVRVYYVASCNECAPSDGIRTLKRMEVVDNVYRVVSLAEGVENLQFEYAFDTDGDGSPDEFRTDISGAGAAASWANVVAVRMHLLMRSTETGTTADTTPAVFDLGPAHPAQTCPDRAKCRLLTTTFRLNNVAGRRES